MTQQRLLAALSPVSGRGASALATTNVGVTDDFSGKTRAETNPD